MKCRSAVAVRAAWSEVRTKLQSLKSFWDCLYFERQLQSSRAPNTTLRFCSLLEKLRFHQSCHSYGSGLLQWKRIQINISPGQRLMRQSPGRLHAQGFYLSSLSRVTNGANFPGNKVWQHVESIAIQEISTSSWYPEFLVVFITYTWLAPTWLTSFSSHPWGRADTADPKPHPKSHCRLSVWPEAPGKQRHSVRPGF